MKILWTSTSLLFLVDLTADCGNAHHIYVNNAIYLWPKCFYVNEVMLSNYHIQIILCLFFTEIIISYSVFGRTSREMTVVAVPFCLIFPEDWKEFHSLPIQFWFRLTCSALFGFCSWSWLLYFVSCIEKYLIYTCILDIRDKKVRIWSNFCFCFELWFWYFGFYIRGEKVFIFL